jgi:hypothetical protein
MEALPRQRGSGSLTKVLPRCNRRLRVFCLQPSGKDPGRISSRRGMREPPPFGRLARVPAWPRAQALLNQFTNDFTLVHQSVRAACRVANSNRRKVNSEVVVHRRKHILIVHRS